MRPFAFTLRIAKILLHLGELCEGLICRNVAVAIVDEAALPTTKLLSSRSGLLDVAGVQVVVDTNSIVRL